MSWEIFEERHQREGDIPGISIRPPKVYFNKQAVNILKAREATALLLLCDKTPKDSWGIAFRISPRSEKRAYAITYMHGDSQASVSVKDFLKYVGITKSMRASLEWNDRNSQFEAKIQA